MSLTQKVLNSAILASSAKIVSKVIGLISTMVLARLLTPEDFGSIAIISIALYFFDILSHAGSEQYLVQKKTVNRSTLFSAWTLNLLLKSSVSVLIMVSAPGVCRFLEHPHLVTALQLSALVLPMQALLSPQYLLLKRQLKYKILFWTSFAERIIALPCVITLALVLKSYWAFVVTDIIVSVFAIILSYCIFPRFPTFSVHEIRHQWSFSKWMLSKSVIGYVRSQIDTVFVSKLFSGATLGNYNLARETAMMPAHFLLSPAIEPLLAAFKNDKHNLDELHNNVAFSLLVALAISLPICGFIALYSPTLVYLLLGPGWSIAAELLPVLVFLFLYWTLLQIVEAAFVAMGKVKMLFIFDILSLVFIIAALFAAIDQSSIAESVALGRVVAGGLTALALTVTLFGLKNKHLYVALQLAVVVFLLSGIALLPSYYLHYHADTKSVVESALMLLVGGLSMVVIYMGILTLIIRKGKHYHVVRMRALLSERHWLLSRLLTR